MRKLDFITTALACAAIFLLAWLHSTDAPPPGFDPEPSIAALLPLVSTEQDQGAQ